MNENNEIEVDDEPRKVARISQSINLHRMQREANLVKNDYFKKQINGLKNTIIILKEKRTRLQGEIKHLTQRDQIEEKEHLAFLNLEKTLFEDTQRLKAEYINKVEKLNKRKAGHAAEIKKYKDYWEIVQAEYISKPKVKELEQIRAQCAEVQLANANKCAAIAQAKQFASQARADLQKHVVAFAEKVQTHEKMSDTQCRRRDLLEKIQELESKMNNLKKPSKKVFLGLHNRVSFSEFDLNIPAPALASPSPEPQTAAPAFLEPDDASLLSLDMSHCGITSDSQLLPSFEGAVTSTPYTRSPTVDDLPPTQTYEPTNQTFEPSNQTYEPTNQTFEPATQVKHVAFQVEEQEVAEGTASESNQSAAPSSTSPKTTDNFDERLYQMSPEPTTEEDYCPGPGETSDITTGDGNPPRTPGQSSEVLVGKSQGQIQNTEVQKQTVQPFGGFPGLQHTQNAAGQQPAVGPFGAVFPGLQQTQNNVGQQTAPFGVFPGLQQTRNTEPQELTARTLGGFPGLQQPNTETQEPPVRSFGFFNFGSSQEKPTSSIFNLF